MLPWLGPVKIIKFNVFCRPTVYNPLKTCQEIWSKDAGFGLVALQRSKCRAPHTDNLRSDNLRSSTTKFVIGYVPFWAKLIKHFCFRDITEPEVMEKATKGTVLFNIGEVKDNYTIMGDLIMRDFQNSLRHSPKLLNILYRCHSMIVATPDSSSFTLDAVSLF